MTILALSLIELTGPDKQHIEVNPSEVVALRAPRPAEATHFAPGVKCLVYTTDTHFIGVRETCAEVRDLIESGAVPLPKPRPPDLK
jgi:hypothetical protein